MKWVQSTVPTLSIYNVQHNMAPTIQAELVYFTIKFSGGSRIFAVDYFQKMKFAVLKNFASTEGTDFLGRKNISNSLQEHLKSSKQVRLHPHMRFISGELLRELFAK